MSTPPQASPSTSATIDLPTPDPSRQSGPPVSRATYSTSWGNQESQESWRNIWGEEGKFTDESSYLFSLYLSYAEKHDKEQTDNWKAGADGILVFTGLFAAALATFVIDSYKSLLPDTGTNTVALLSQISQQLSNGSQISAQASVPPLSSFRPSSSAVWVNALWFLSLVISLFCALLATLQQRWARGYLRLTQPPCAIHKRARLRSFFAEGVDRFYLAFAVEAIPALLHISMFLFLTGLVISLFTIHHTIAYIVLATTAVGGLAYTAITVMPVFYYNSPYHSPFSALAWVIPRKTAYILLCAADYIVQHTRSIQTDYISSFSTRILTYKRRLSMSMAAAAEKAAGDQHWSMDSRALSWTLDRSDEESELEKFVAGIPRFIRSAKLKNSAEVLTAATNGSSLHPNLYREITNLLINAWEPGLLPDSKEFPESVRQRRIKICLEALYFLPHALEKILRRASEELGNEKVRRAFVSVLDTDPSWKMALQFSKRKKRYNKKFESTMITAQCMATVIATRLPATMSRSILTTQFGIEKPDVLQRYEESRDSFLLKNLNHFLANTVLKSIHIEGTDIFLSTVRIVKRLQFKSAAKELRVEFENHFLSIRRLACNPKESATVQKNAMELFKELASLRNSAPGDRSPPAQTDVPTAAPPGNDSSVSAVIPTQFPLPSPPPGDAYITIQPLPETPTGETYPLMRMPSPQSSFEPPHLATLPRMPMPSRDSSSASEKSIV